MAKTTISVQVDTEWKAILDKFCKKNKITLAAMIRDAVEEYVERHKGQTAKVKAVDWE